MIEPIEDKFRIMRVKHDVALECGRAPFTLYMALKIILYGVFFKNVAYFIID